MAQTPMSEFENIVLDSTLMKSIPLFDLDKDLNKLLRTKLSQARGAGESIKPGVERSGTPGTEERKNPARESGQ
jgi:hypothetical protein